MGMSDLCVAMDRSYQTAPRLHLVEPEGQAGTRGSLTHLFPHPQREGDKMHLPILLE